MSYDFFAIINGQLLNPGESPVREDLLIRNDKIVAVGLDNELPPNTTVIDATDLIITPGLIDQHIHGGYGCDFNRAEVSEMLAFAEQLPRHGVTSILPTIMTDCESKIKEQIAKIKTAKLERPANSVKMLGIHLEGPYLCPKYKGIHPACDILLPTVENFKKIYDPEIKVVTYAPELDENLELTRYLSELNIIPSAGHTNATFDELQTATEHGLRQITHIFNAMPSLHHRNPGVLGGALTNDSLFAEVIADGLHLHPAVVSLISRAKPASKVIFISDSLPLTQSDTDSAEFGGHKIFKQDGKAVNSDGVMAGSLAFLDSVLKTFIKMNIADFSQFLRFTTSNVAENLGLQDIGYIQTGKTADIVLWDADYNPVRTIINGQTAHRL